MSKQKKLFDSQVSPEKIIQEARKWTEENGLNPPFQVSRPEKTEFGWQVFIEEKNRPQRVADALFDKYGKRRLWEIQITAR